MARRGMPALFGVIAVAVVGCGGANDNGGALDVPSSKEQTTADVTAKPLDKSPFCVAVRALEELGTAPQTGASTQQGVLAQNAQLAKLIDDASNNKPQDAPPDVGSLFDDYRLITKAIVSSAGDTQAAMAALSSAEPDVAARISQQDGHRAAFTFFAARCGTARPT